MDAQRRISIERVGAIEGYHLVAPMLEAHRLEVGKFLDITVVKPDLEKYAYADQHGRFIGLVAKINDEPIGYSANFLNFNAHYSDLFYCQNDVLYVQPEHRKGRIGLSLIRKTESLARAADAKLMLWHAKDDTSLNELLPRLKYEIMDVIWARKL